MKIAGPFLLDKGDLRRDRPYFLTKGDPHLGHFSDDRRKPGLGGTSVWQAGQWAGPGDFPTALEPVLKALPS